MINLRLAKKDEFQKLQNLNDEVFTDNSKYDSDINLNWPLSDLGRKYFTEVLKDPESICVIAEEGEIPVGYVVATPKDFEYRFSKYIEINNMGVSPNYRSQGVGSKLIQKVLEIAKERGFQKAYVSSYSGNLMGIKFYEKNGFTKIDVSFERDI